MSKDTRELRRNQKHKLRQVRAAIGKILWEQWDPIGVNDESAARDEYDAYVGGIHNLLINNSSDEELMRHLLHLEQINMGLRGSTSDHLFQVVKALRKIKIEPSDTL
jgi:hypothetical protein